jgi:FKBP-type peptidyl-prolyl cis-trans isomerase FkpA
MKNATVLFLFAILGLLALDSCKSDGKKKTLNGFDVTFLDDQPGDPAKEGDYIYYRFNVMSKDSLIFSSVSRTPIVKVKLPKIEKVDMKKADPMAEALNMMSKGDSVIVSQVLDDERKRAFNLPNVDILDFHIRMVDIKNEADYKADLEVEQKEIESQQKVLTEQAGAIAEKAAGILKDYKAGKLKSSIIETPSGLKYIMHEAGTGAKAEKGKTVSVNYFGMLTDGTRFDDSWSRGQPISFPLGNGQVIKGWDEGIANLNEGSKATLIIPSSLGYGAQGSPPAIPPDAELVFYVELVKVN